MARYLQTLENSCGAVALMCAAHELGVTKLRKLERAELTKGWTPMADTNGVSNALEGWSGEELDALFPCKTVEDAIYAITSGDLASYSMPSRVVACARFLGLESDIYVPSGFLKSILLYRYPRELGNCQTQPNVNIFKNQSPGAVVDERELIILTTKLIGLHYVMKRPRRHHPYMDPGDGQDHASFDAMNSGLKLYKDTHISIIVRKRTKFI